MIIILIIVVFILMAIILFFTTQPQRYRILRVEHRSGEIDYTVQRSCLFGFPGTWITVSICMGYYMLILRGCPLEVAKYYLEKLRKEDEAKRGYKVKKTEVYEEV